jgi:hypothetical protein
MSLSLLKSHLGHIEVEEAEVMPEHSDHKLHQKWAAPEPLGKEMVDSGAASGMRAQQQRCLIRSLNKFEWFKILVKNQTNCDVYYWVII